MLYEDLMHFYISPKFSLFLILELDPPATLKVLSVMLFHHNSHVGTFIAVLNVNKADQKKKIGPSSLMMIQHLYFRCFDIFSRKAYKLVSKPAKRGI